MRLRHAPLFWLGFFPLVILLWAWADSMSYATSWQRAAAADPLQGSQLLLWRSEIRYSRNDIDTRTGDPNDHEISLVPTGKWGKLKREFWGDLPAPPSWAGQPHWYRWFPEQGEGGHVQSFRRGTLRHQWFGIPLWMIGLAYLPLWLAPAWWQARRIARKHAAALPVAEAGK